MTLTSGTKPMNNCLMLIFAFLIGNLLTADMFRLTAAQDPSTITRPPVAPVRPVVDDYFGTKITDPYGYMERLDDPEVAKWMRAENDYARRILARISGRDQLLARIEQLDNSVPARVGGIVRLATGRYFYYKLLSTESVATLYMRDGMNSQETPGQETLLVDPQRISGKDTPSAINYFWPSSDGRYVVYGISLGGSEKAVLHIMDTETRRDTD